MKRSSRQIQNSSADLDSSSLPSAIPSSFGEEKRSRTAEQKRGQQMSSTNTPSAKKRGAGSRHKERFILSLWLLLASSSMTPTMNWLTSSGAAKMGKLGKLMISQIISQLFLQTGNSLESTSLENKFCHGIGLAVGPSTEIHFSRLDDQTKEIIKNGHLIVKIAWQQTLSIGI